MSDNYPGQKRQRFNRRERGENRPGTSSNARLTTHHDNKHPSNLKGREIGMWYSNRNRARDAKRSSQMTEEDQQAYDERRLAQMDSKREKVIRKQTELNKKPLGRILLSDAKKEHINQLLQDSASCFGGANEEKFDHLQDTDFKHEFLQHVNGSIIKKLESCSRDSTTYKNEVMDLDFCNELKKKQYDKAYQEMQKFRQKLPSFKMQEEILELVNSNQVVVISGETGCGKTTQVAQFILDDYILKGMGSECRIICTQPRRISAISVAERVAQERAEPLGVSSGYLIRLEKNLPRDRGSIMYCTTGVLLKCMETNPALNQVSHIILDEIHERDVISDFTITVLKDVINYRPDLKVILMSATLNAEAFSRYYNEAPHINIPGFTYPVVEYYLEDVLQKTRYKFKGKQEPIWMQRRNKTYEKNKEWSGYIQPYIRQLEAEGKYDRDVLAELWNPMCEKLDMDLIFELLRTICLTKGKDDDDNGAILVFLPGFAQIQSLIKKLQQSNEFAPAKYVVIPLHSQLSTVDQKSIFKAAPKGMRKIIIATNIAETSITIDDVTTVIDCGYIKMSNLDPESGIETLQEEWVSCANASQRKGRAGRVKPGVCYHLFTRVRSDLLDKFLKPEVLRKRLEDVILQLKMLQLGDAELFLLKLMDPPDSNNVKSSVDLLERLGALDEEEALTPLGLHMAKLPVGAQCSKMLIMGALFSCLDPVLSIAASLDFKDAFLLSTSPDHKRQDDRRRYELSNGTNSDHLLMHYAIRGFEDSHNSYSFCQKYNLSMGILRLLKDMRSQFAQLLFDMKFIEDTRPKSEAHNHNSDNLSLVKAVICSGLYPKVGIIGKRKALRTVEHDRMEFHPKSVLRLAEVIPSPLIVYYLRLKSSKTFVHDATVVFPLPLVFFGDQFKKLHNDPSDPFHGISINGTMRFACTESTANVIENLRKRLNQILEYKAAHPGCVDWSLVTPEVKILRAIIDLITTEDMEQQDLSDFDDV